MDSSLAKGLKNQLFRDLNADIDVVIDRLVRFLREQKLDRRRKHWHALCKEVSDILGPFSLAKYVGGSKRKPILCVATFEGATREFNSWKEQALECSLITICANPFVFESAKMGFSIGEHAIKRVYERTMVDADVLDPTFLLPSVLRELGFVPHWSPYWTANILKKEFDTIELAIPGPNGIFLGSISKKACHKVELRTFIGIKQMSDEQHLTRNSMLVAQTKFSDIVPFLFSPSLGSIMELEVEIDRYLSDIKI